MRLGPHDHRYRFVIFNDFGLLFFSVGPRKEIQKFSDDVANRSSCKHHLTFAPFGHPGLRLSQNHEDIINLQSTEKIWDRF